MKNSNSKGSLLIEIAIALALSTLTLVIVFSSLNATYLSVEHNKQSRLKLEADIQQTTDSKGSGLYYTPCIFTNNELNLHVDIDQASDYGGDCGGVITDELAQMPLHSEIMIASSTAFDSIGANTYIGSLLSHSTSSESNFYVYSSQHVPQFSTSYNQSIRALDATNPYVYVAASGTSSQFHIIDASHPEKPILISKATLPGVAGSYPDAISIQYYRKKVYIGTHRTAGREFHIFDVTNPSAPVWLGSREVNHNINDITVRWPYAYLATSGNTKDVIILNISNPSSITESSAISFNGSEDSQKILLSGNTLYVGRKRSTIPQNPEFVALDVTDPISPKQIASGYFKSGVTGICAIGTHIYLALSSPRNQIISLTLASSSQVLTTPLYTLDQSPKALDCENGVLTTLL